MKQMNIKKDLIRFWIAITFLWIVFAAITAGSELSFKKKITLP
jgi:hypothetical protein